MRIKNSDDIKKLGAHAQRKINAALQQGGINNKKRISNVAELAGQHRKGTQELSTDAKASPPHPLSKAQLEQTNTDTPKKKKKPSKVMVNDDGLKYCPYPNPDPSVSLHIALLREFGSWWDGGELADEMIIPGHQVRFRYDFCFPRYRLAIEIDGFGYHRDLDSFKKDREKQKHAMKKGWVVHRLTNSDLRHAFDDIIPDIKVMLSYRERHEAELTTIGKTWCTLVL